METSCGSETLNIGTSFNQAFLPGTSDHLTKIATCQLKLQNLSQNGLPCFRDEKSTQIEQPERHLRQNWMDEPVIPHWAGLFSWQRGNEATELPS